jgi:hypothetical protein
MKSFKIIGLLFLLFSISSCKEEHFDINNFKSTVEGKSIGCGDFKIKSLELNQQEVDEAIKNGEVVGYITISNEEEEFTRRFSLSADFINLEDAYKHIVLMSETEESTMVRFLNAVSPFSYSEGEGIKFELTNEELNLDTTETSTKVYKLWITYTDEDNKVKHQGEYQLDNILQTNNKVDDVEISNWTCANFNGFFASSQHSNEDYPYFEIKNFRMKWLNKSGEEMELNGTLSSGFEEVVINGKIINLTRGDNYVDNKEIRCTIIKS